MRLLSTLLLLACGRTTLDYRTTGQPVVESLTATPALVTAGEPVTLLALFRNGAGVIAPDGTSIFSNRGLDILPPAPPATADHHEVTYTLVVSNDAGERVTQTV